MRNRRYTPLGLALCLLPLTAQAGGDSDFDPAFGNGGYSRVFYDVAGGHRDYPQALAKEPSGNYVIAGEVESSGSTGRNVGIARISRANGVALASYHYDAGFSTVREITVDGGGRPVVVGTTPANTDGQADLGIVRFTTTGNPDTSFSSDGVLSYDSPNSSNAIDEPLALITRSNGDITVLVEEVLLNNQPHPFVLVQIPANGQNPSTLALGATTVGFNGGSMLLQPDGKLIVVVNVDIGGACLRPRLFRFAANTLVNLDTAFGVNGILTLTPPSGGGNCTPTANAIALDRSGRIVLGTVAASVNASLSWLARLTANGVLDTSFSGDGWASLPRPSNGNFHDIYGVGVQSDGAILAAGTFVNGNAAIGQRPILSRVLSDGTPDVSFNPSISSQTYTAGSNVIQQNALGMVMEGNQAVMFGTHLANAPQDHDYQIMRTKGTLPRHGFE